MASPAWYATFMSAFAPTRRYEALFAMSDKELAARGFDRAGLQRTYIAGLGAY